MFDQWLTEEIKAFRESQKVATERKMVKWAIYAGGVADAYEAARALYRVNHQLAQPGDVTLAYYLGRH